jgi:hypothetical protein
VKVGAVAPRGHFRAIGPVGIDHVMFKPQVQKWFSLSGVPGLSVYGITPAGCPHRVHTCACCDGGFVGRDRPDGRVASLRSCCCCLLPSRCWSPTSSRMRSRTLSRRSISICRRRLRSRWRSSVSSPSASLPRDCPGWQIDSLPAGTSRGRMEPQPTMRAARACSLGWTTRMRPPWSSRSSIGSRSFRASTSCPTRSRDRLEGLARGHRD